jgi:hypothetical protein
MDRTRLLKTGAAAGAVALVGAEAGAALERPAHERALTST